MKNTLELKRLGVVDKYNGEEDQRRLNKTRSNFTIWNKYNNPFEPELPKPKNPYAHVESKHMWWNNGDFDKYYNPMK